MVQCSVTVHPRGLSLKEAAKAWYLRDQRQMTWRQIRLIVRNLRGKPPSLKAIRNAVHLMSCTDARGVPKTNYENCGRRPTLTPAEERRIMKFVRKWRRKVFCTCKYIRQELKLDVHVKNHKPDFE